MARQKKSQQPEVREQKSLEELASLYGANFPMILAAYAEGKITYNETNSLCELYVLKAVHAGKLAMLDEMQKIIREIN